MNEYKNMILMGMATVMTFGLLYLLMFYPIPDDNAQILLAIVGPTLGFFFGSSVNKQSGTPPTITKGDNNATTITNSPATPDA